MAEFTHPIIGEVFDLDLPEPEFSMITHGSALVARGLRPEHMESDIDLVVSQRNIAHLRDQLGWHAVRQNKYYFEDEPTRIRFTISPDGRFDVFAHDFIPLTYQFKQRGRLYMPELLSRHDSELDQDSQTGIWVASCLHVAATKLETGRAKDARDIALIQQKTEVTEKAAREYALAA